MNAENLYRWLSVTGSLASVIGLPIAIWQIAKTRTAAEASKRASIETRDAISRNQVLTELQNCLKLIDELKDALRNNKFEIAQVKIGDLIKTMIQVRVDLNGRECESVLRDSLPQLVIVRDKIEKKVLDQSAKIVIDRSISRLSKIADDLTELIGLIRTDSNGV